MPNVRHIVALTFYSDSLDADDAAAVCTSATGCTEPAEWDEMVFHRTADDAAGDWGSYLYSNKRCDEHRWEMADAVQAKLDADRIATADRITVGLINGIVGFEGR